MSQQLETFFFLMEMNKKLKNKGINKIILHSDKRCEKNKTGSYNSMT